MLLHQFSVSLTHCQSSLARKTHEDIRHTATQLLDNNGLECHVPLKDICGRTECCDSVTEAVNVINSHSVIH